VHGVPAALGRQARWLLLVSPAVLWVLTGRLDLSPELRRVRLTRREPRPH
jgi:hypothetical protein